jgi:hypothetical protein
MTTDTFDVQQHRHALMYHYTGRREGSFTTVRKVYKMYKEKGIRKSTLISGFTKLWFKAWQDEEEGIIQFPTMKRSVDGGDDLSTVAPESSRASKRSL